MTRDEKVTRLIQLLKEENPGYAVIQIPDGAEERRRLLRSLMNVRWPGEASPEYLGFRMSCCRKRRGRKGSYSRKSSRQSGRHFQRQNFGTGTGLPSGRETSPGLRRTPLSMRPTASCWGVLFLPRLYRQCHPFRGRDPAPQRMRPDHGRRRPGRENRTGQDHSRL